MDIFGLGSLMYMIMMGHFPHKSLVQNRTDYDIVVNQLFSKCHFPDVEHIQNGQCIQGCWEGRFTTAIDVLYSFEREKSALTLISHRYPPFRKQTTYKLLSPEESLS